MKNIYILQVRNRAGYEFMDSELGYYSDAQKILLDAQELVREKIFKDDPIEDLFIVQQPLNLLLAKCEYFHMYERDWVWNKFTKGVDYDEFVSHIK